MGKKTKVGKARKDKFYQLAKETGFRSRAAFKLIQLNRKFGFLQESQVCIDLCAAPGGWMQVAKQNMPVSSIVIGVDLFPIRPIPGCIGLAEDITTERCKLSLTKELQSWKVDVVLHDGAPNVGRNWLHDAYQQICLTLNALKLSTHFLRSGGWFVTKVFRSKDYNALLWVLKQLFRKVHATKPSASRKESAEIFIVCQGYLAPDSIDPKLLDSKFVFEEFELEGKKKSSLLHPDKQKRIKAEGYTEQDIALRNNLAASDFFRADNGLAALQGIAAIEINEDRFKQHPKTTTEILECCKDLKVLNRKDIKGLLAWWRALKEEFYQKYEPKTDIIEEADSVKRPLTQGEVEDMEEEELQKQIAELAGEEGRELKRKHKKTLKSKSKLQEKMNLNMIIKGDEGPREEGPEDIFNLKDISSNVELDAILDVAPDFDLEAGAEVEAPILPKYKKYDKDDKRLDDDGNYENDDEPEISDEEQSDNENEEEGFGLNDGERKDDAIRNRKQEISEHPLIKSGDFRDKDMRRQQRVQLWFEKDNLQKLDTDDDEDFDVVHMAEEYEKKGVAILGERITIFNKESKIKLEEKAKLQAKYQRIATNCCELGSDSEKVTINTGDGEKIPGDRSKELKTKKIRLTQSELALGAMLIRGKKTQRDLVDRAYNRYSFNDENLPSWFTQDEEVHMTAQLPVPKELEDEYKKKVQELNVRPIKKVMEAKARKRRRVLKRLSKAKKQAEKIMESTDVTAHEKARQIRKLYKKAQEKKKETTYVVAKKKQTTGRRAKRPSGVKGRYRLVDPRQKKDKRSLNAIRKRHGKI